MHFIRRPGRDMLRGNLWPHASRKLTNPQSGQWPWKRSSSVWRTDRVDRPAQVIIIRMHRCYANCYMRTDAVADPMRGRCGGIKWRSRSIQLPRKVVPLSCVTSPTMPDDWHVRLQLFVSGTRRRSSTTIAFLCLDHSNQMTNIFVSLIRTRWPPSDA